MTYVKNGLIATGQTLLRLFVLGSVSRSLKIRKTNRVCVVAVVFSFAFWPRLDSTPATANHWTASFFNEDLSSLVKMAHQCDEDCNKKQASHDGERPLCANHKQQLENDYLDAIRSQAHHLPSS
jgi:hypothetical protein